MKRVNTQRVNTQRVNTQRDISPLKRFLLAAWFAIAVSALGYLAFTYRGHEIVKIIAAVIATPLYWLGYGRFHHQVFKNTTFNKPAESIKGFSFFLLFLMIYVIVFGNTFLKQI